MQHGGKLQTCPFRGTLLMNKNSDREHILQNNNKNISRPKDFNKNTDPTQSTIARHQPKSNSLGFEEPYDHINTMENTHDETHIIDKHNEKSEEMMRSKKNNSLKKQIKIKSLKKKQKIYP